MRASSLTTMRGGVLWLLLGVIALVVMLATLLLFAPAGSIAMLLDRTDGDARLHAPAGRVHAGSGELQLGRQPLGRLNWRLRPAALLRGRAVVDLELEASDHWLEATADISGRGRIELRDLTGAVNEAGLQALLLPYDIHPSGDFRITSGQASAHGRELEDSRADGRYSGGFVRYFLAGQGWTSEFPPLDARLRMQEGEPVLRVTDPAGDDLIDVRIDRSGWAHLRIRYRFIRMAGFPWPDAPEPDTVLLELSERVL